MPRTIPIVVSNETFEKIFLIDTARVVPHHDAPDCPLANSAGYVNKPGEEDRGIGKCDCRNELRLFAIAEVGHSCGDEGRCPARTYLAPH
jgi:hypothetical protein